MNIFIPSKNPKFLKKALFLSFLCFYTPCTASDSESDGEGAGVNMQGVAVYDQDTEYYRHSRVSDKFFKKVTRLDPVRALIHAFGQEVTASQPITPIVLDGLSSRTRILLFRELTTISGSAPRTVPFTLHGKAFDLNLKPLLRQPGDGIIMPRTHPDTLGTYDRIHDVLEDRNAATQRDFATNLLASRIAGNAPIYPAAAIPGIRRKNGQKIDLDLFNVLLDFEVARRLQNTTREGIGATNQRSPGFSDRIDQNNTNLRAQARHLPEVARLRLEHQKVRKINYMTQDQGTYDDVPVASGVVGILKTSARPVNGEQFQAFFENHGIDYNMTYGNLNPFKGAAEPNRREDAVKRILFKLRDATPGQLPVNSNREQIHQEYLEVFGGGNESDGDEYLTSDDEAESDDDQD